MTETKKQIDNIRLLRLCCFVAGLALIMEGVLSGCYHVCPNNSNFQFGK